MAAEELSIPRQPSVNQFQDLITLIDWSKVLVSGYGSVRIQIRGGRATMWSPEPTIKLD